MKNKKFVSGLCLLSSLFAGCAHGYDKTAPYVNRDLFMRKWYVQAGRFTAFEKDVYNATETYTWNQDQQRIDIEFHYNKGSLNGPVKSIPQKGWIINEQTNATWKVSPFWPLKFSYLVIGLDPEYKWTVIGVPNQAYIWVMTSEKIFPKEEVQKILKLVEDSGYSVENIVYVPQGNSPK